MLEPLSWNKCFGDRNSTWCFSDTGPKNLILTDHLPECKLKLNVYQKESLKMMYKLNWMVYLGILLNISFITEWRYSFSFLASALNL